MHKSITLSAGLQKKRACGERLFYKDALLKNFKLDYGFERGRTLES
jgi:hypothetical protein